MSTLKSSFMCLIAVIALPLLVLHMLIASAWPLRHDAGAEANCRYGAHDVRVQSLSRSSTFGLLTHLLDAALRTNSEQSQSLAELWRFDGSRLMGERAEAAFLPKGPLCRCKATIRVFCQYVQL